MHLCWTQTETVISLTLDFISSHWHKLQVHFTDWWQDKWLFRLQKKACLIQHQRNKHETGAVISHFTRIHRHACSIHINVLHPRHDQRPEALIFPQISMHTGIKILSLTSLPPWKYINKSCWVSVNVPTDGARAPLRPAEMPACCFLLSLAGGLIWLPTHDPQTLAVVVEMDLLFWCAKFFFSLSLFKLD